MRSRRRPGSRVTLPTPCTVRHARLWTVAVSTFKAETYRFLRLERPTADELAAGALFPPGTVHLPDWVESEWLKQFVAEQLVTVKTRRGFARLEW